VSYFITIIFGAYVISKLKIKPLILFYIFSVVLSLIVEYLNTEASNWIYFNGGQPPIYVAIGWIYPLALIFYLSAIIEPYVKLKINSLVPPLVCYGFFFIFAYLEGYTALLPTILYIVMAILGFFASYTVRAEWTVSMIISGIIIGSLSEASGSYFSLWDFQFGELLPIHMAFAWSVNAFALAGLLKLFGIKHDMLMEG